MKYLIINYIFRDKNGPEVETQEKQDNLDERKIDLEDRRLQLEQHEENLKRENRRHEKSERHKVVELMGTLVQKLK